MWRGRERLFWWSPSGPRSCPFRPFMAGYQAYLYTDAVSFCGAVCHSMTPEYVTYQLSPHARVACAQCHVGPGATGYIESKIRGMVELVETIQDRLSAPDSGSRDGAAPDTRQLRAVPLAGSFLRSPARCARCISCPTSRTPAGRSTCWCGSAGARPWSASQMGIHWHVASKVEYVATDAERQNITWVRAVDPRTGQANVYTSQPRPSTTAPAGEIRTMDCVDCHNRPSHILQAPDQSVDVALADGRLDAVSSVHQAAGRSGAYRGLRGPRAGAAGNRQRPARLLSEDLPAGVRRQAAGDRRPPSLIYRTLTTAISFRR